MDKDHLAVDITKEASDTKFTDCKIYGKVKNSGKRTKFIGTEIRLFKKEHPFFFWLSAIASIIAIFEFIQGFITNYLLNIIK